MQVLGSHQAEPVLTATASPLYAEEPYRPHQFADAAVLDTMANIVELSEFKRGTSLSDRDLPPPPDSRGPLSMDLATSLIEELQQARFREARRLKRVETLEREIQVARAQNEALRLALESTRREDGEVTVSDPDRARPTAETVRSRRLGRSLIRLLRSRP